MAPQTRQWREDSQTQNTESGFGKDRSGHADGGLDEDRLHDIGQQMARENASVGSAERFCGQDELQFLDLQHLSASETRVAGPTGNDERENHLADPRTKEGGEGNPQKDSRKREKRVNGEQIHDAVERATVVAGEHCSTWR